RSGEGESLEGVFRAAKDKRTFRHAPKLEPSAVQQNLAGKVYKRIRQRLPPRIVKRLEERFRNEGHYINTVSYYPFPILADKKSKNLIKDLVDWGHTYAAILKKVASAYRQPGNRYCRRFLHHALIKYIPPHLLHLIEGYRTIDDLAGAHLGDDNMQGKSIEWNLGAVGGLDEGYLVAQEVAQSLAADFDYAGTPFLPVERDAVGAIREALHWAYESFCLANGILPTQEPFIACVEYDDIYGSTVSICDRLEQRGEKISLCFGHELVYRDDRLFTPLGQPIDILYMDCHFEDLSPGHPILEAIGANKVAVDGSPFARLVLRSKVILALLCSPVFLRHLDLDNYERDMLGHHLMPTYLWRRKTFKDRRKPFSVVFQSLLSDQNMDTTWFPLKKSRALNGENKEEKFVVKIGIGSVYGGSAVSVVLQEKGKYQTKDAAYLISRLIRNLAAENASIRGKRLHNILKAPLKNEIKDLALRAASRRLATDGEENCHAKDPFWQEVEEIWRNLLSDFSTKDCHAISPDEFVRALIMPLSVYFDIDLAKAKSTCRHMWSRLEKDIQKILLVPPEALKTTRALERCLMTLGQTLASIRFQEQVGPKIFGHLMADLKNVVSPQEQVTYRQLISRVMHIVDSFFEKRFGISLPAKVRGRLLSILLTPFIQEQLISVNPIVLQHYLPSDVLEGESGLHITNRIHVLFTRDGPQVSIAGTQVFFLKELKPDNRYKMTASLWVNK
ncbi:MAG: hypothetical protein SV775_05330, partial [Thermodesulfobacteriota bacterium]|nr:hypothetical protein [Thermodesulfobacteriota bacterium]